MTRLGQFVAATMFGLSAVAVSVPASAATHTINLSGNPANGTYLPVEGGTNYVLSFLLPAPVVIQSGDILQITGTLSSALTVPFGTGEIFLTALPNAALATPPSGSLSTASFTINGMTQTSNCVSCMSGGVLDVSTSTTPFDFTTFTSTMTLGQLVSANPRFNGPFAITAFTLNMQSISPVPEPATWAMMILGFGAVGGAIRYRRRKATVSYA